MAQIKLNFPKKYQTMRNMRAQNNPQKLTIVPTFTVRTVSFTEKNSFIHVIENNGFSQCA